VGIAMLFLLSCTIAKAQTPPPASTYQFQREGIFGCSLTGSYAMSVGALASVGGVYVPVNDAAVTLNTGYLVYKECVLDGVVKRQVEQITTGLAKKRVLEANTARDGNPQYVRNINQDTLEETNKAFVQLIQNQDYSSTLCPAFKSEVRETLIRKYAMTTQKPNAAFACTLNCSEADRRAFLAGDFTKCGSFKGLMELVLNPANNATGAYVFYEDTTQSRIDTVASDFLEELGWGRGYYSTKDDTGNPLTAQIVTPSMLIADSLKDILGSGFRQLENADEVDQIINSLFSGLLTQASTDVRGLFGLTQGNGGQQSYLDRMAAESARGLREGALNAALQILNATRPVEAGFLSAKTSTANTLTRMIQKLRAVEAQCWNLIVENKNGLHVCATSLTKDNTCTSVPIKCVKNATGDSETCQEGISLNVATSTVFSQAVIDAVIAPVATQVASEIKVSEKALSRLDQLIIGITNNGSITNQRLALEQLDSLVAERALHNQYDLLAAEKQKEDIETTVTQLVDETITSWADSPDPNTGWCNVKNQAVIDRWIGEWKKKLLTI